MTDVHAQTDLAAEVGELLLESGQDDWSHITPSIYETARVVSVAPWLNGHVARLRYLCDTQAGDGGWGIEGFRLVPTLSAVEALLVEQERDSGFPREQIDHAVTRGIATLRGWLADPAPLPDTVAIELIVPRLIGLINERLAGDAPLPVPPGTEPVLLEQLRALAAAGTPLPPKLWHSWETFHPGGECPAPVHLTAGAVSCSPAATAAWLGAAPPAGDPALEFLDSLQRSMGGPVPVATPMPFFERSWILNMLATHEVPHTVPDSLLASLDAALSEHGAGAGPGLPVDGDDTACVLYALALNGYDRKPDPMMTYFKEDHFLCYPEERTPSPTTNAHAIEAVAHYVARHPDEQEGYGAAVEHAITWLLDAQNADGSWTDKWHGSPYYATVCCAQALSTYGGDRSRAAVERAVGWARATRQRDAWWGHGTGTVEETAYAAWLLLLSREQDVREELAAAERTLLTGEISDASPTLWIGKDVYTPVRIARVTRLTALHAIRKS